MQRVTISLPEDTLKELEENAVMRGISVAKYMRQLIEQGRQISEMEREKLPPVDSAWAEKPPAQLEFSLMKHYLEWALESRYLLRYLVDSLEQQSQEKRTTVLNTATERAQKLVTKLLEKA